MKGSGPSQEVAPQACLLSHESVSTVRQRAEKGGSVAGEYDMVLRDRRRFSWR